MCAQYHKTTESYLLLPPASEGFGTVIFSVLCVSPHGGGGTYVGWGRGTLDEGEGTYLGWGRVPTLDGEGFLPWMEGTGYLPWKGGGVPTLEEKRGYLLWMGGGTYFGWGGYLPQMGEGYRGRVSTLDGGGGYLPWTGYATGGMPLAFMQEDFLVI